MTLGATAAICTKNPDMDAAEKAMEEMNNITSGVYIMIDQDNRINYLCNFFAPSCHILKKTLPLVAEHIDRANAAFEETYLEKTDPNN